MAKHIRLDRTLLCFSREQGFSVAYVLNCNLIHTRFECIFFLGVLVSRFIKFEKQPAIFRKLQNKF